MDTSGIINQLMALETQPIAALQNQQTTNNNKQAAWLSLTTMLNTLQNAAQAIENPATFMGTTASFTNGVAGNPSILNLNATANIAPGSHGITVGALAQQQETVGAQGYSSTTTAISGLTSLAITNTASGKTTAFNQTTLEGLQSAINAANIGVRATVVNTAASGATPNYVMQLAAANSGAVNAFTVSTNGSASGAKTGTLDFANSASEATSLGGSSAYASAVDAALTVDGISIKRSSNNITDIIPGLSMSLTALGSGTINLSNDVATTVKNITNFVAAYDSVTSFINAQETYDPTAATQPPLFADSTLQTIQTTLQGVFSGAGTGIGNTSNAYGSMSDVGINTNYFQGNTITVDTNALTQALQANPTALQNLFTPSASGTGAASTYSFVSSLGNATPGVYASTMDSAGILTMQLKGAGAAVTMTNAGNGYFTGPAGSALDGVVLLASSTAAGTGTWTFSGGAALMVDARVKNFSSYNGGLITTAENSLTQNNQDLQTQIGRINARAAQMKTTLQQQFTNLEKQLASLQAQGQYLTQQLNYLPGWTMPRTSNNSTA
ncbi:MAG: flagellar filament capping protein FliD [Nitrospinae bacterium]|nr:flagellar filament capping protein FliD [Nitrospinota bacterium]